MRMFLLVNKIFRFKLVFISLVIFFVGVSMELSRDFSGIFPNLKYIALIIFLIAQLNFKKALAGDLISLVSLLVFYLFTILFTLFNNLNEKAVFLLLGYGLCIASYYHAAKGSNELQEVIRDFLFFSCFVFVFLTIPQVASLEAYSLNKLQFTGFYSNPNAFSGIAGFFWIFIFSNIYYKNNRKRKKNILFTVLLLLTVFLFLSFSRGALLAVYVSMTSLLLSKGRVRLAIVIFFVFAMLGLYILSGEINFYAIGNRDIFEATGRLNIFNIYVKEISNNNIIFGTGISELSGRIKSELSFLDILLFSGVGALGFFVFMVRSIYFAFESKAPSGPDDWVGALFVYIAVISIFEGYAANIVSLPSIFLYILPGILYANFYKRHH